MTLCRVSASCISFCLLTHNRKVNTKYSNKIIEKLPSALRIRRKRVIVMEHIIYDGIHSLYIQSVCLLSHATCGKCVRKILEAALSSSSSVRSVNAVGVRNLITSSDDYKATTATQKAQQTTRQQQQQSTSQRKDTKTNKKHK